MNGTPSNEAPLGPGAHPTLGSYNAGPTCPTLQELQVFISILKQNKIVSPTIIKKKYIFLCYNFSFF